MKLFLLKVSFFLATLVITFEIIIRIMNLTPDIPQRVIINNIQKYKVGQSGMFSRNSTEKWRINEYGWPGIAELDKDTIIALIGDSFIENFHNPYSCHQAHFLGEILPEFGFFEAARSGMSLIEELEVNKHVSAEISPILTLIYINEKDLYESIEEIEYLDDVTQISLKTDHIHRGKIKGAFFKKILYNVKVLHYLYLNKPKDLGPNFSTGAKREKTSLLNDTLIDGFLDLMTDRYELSSVIFVFHPETDRKIIKLFYEKSLKIIPLSSSNYKSWKLPNDSHWNCEGHKSASEQVAKFLRSEYFPNS